MNEPFEEDVFDDDAFVGFDLVYPSGKQVVDGLIFQMASVLNTEEDNVAKELERTTGITIPRFIELVDDYNWDANTIWTVWVKSHDPKSKALMRELFERHGFRVDRRAFCRVMNLGGLPPPCLDRSTILSLWEQKTQPTEHKNWFQKIFGL